MNQSQLLKDAVSEIRALRRQNELLSARLDMFDMCMAVLHTDVARQKSISMTPDICWQIEQSLMPQATEASVIKENVIA